MTEVFTITWNDTAQALIAACFRLPLLSRRLLGQPSGRLSRGHADSAGCHVDIVT